MIRWSSSQWIVLINSAALLLAGLTIAIGVSNQTWPPQWAWAGFALTCAGWAELTMLVHETRVERQESRLHRVGGGIS